MVKELFDDIINEYAALQERLDFGHQISLFEEKTFNAENRRLL